MLRDLLKNSKLTASETKQFCKASETKQVCEASSKIRSWQYRKRSNSARLPSKKKSWVQSWRLRASAFCDFSIPYPKVYCACHEEVTPGHTKWCTWSCKVILANLKSNVSENQRPDPWTCLIEMSLVLCLPCDVHLCKSSSNVPRLPSFLGLLQNPHVCEGAEFIAPAAQTEGPTSKSDANMVFLQTFWLRDVLRTTAACAFWRAQLPKMLRNSGVFSILASKCASCQSRLQFLNSSTFKCAPAMRWFYRFNFDMCFAPQPRALFQRLNFKKRCGVEVFWTGQIYYFRAATACTFCAAELPRVLRGWGVFDVLIFDLPSRQMAPHPPL